MKNFLLLSFLVLMVGGCAGVPNTSDTILAVRFRSDPLDHDSGEAIDQLEITAWPASVYRIDKLPYDWSASASIPLSLEVTCGLTCGHDSSAISDVRELEDLVYLRVSRANRKDLKVTARIWTTRGPDGPGRIVSLDPDQLTLK